MRVRSILLVSGLLFSGVVVLASAGGPSAGARALAVADSGGGGFSATETISRANDVNGVESVVDTRTVALNVSQTDNLQGRQEIDVSWSGAHPTGGIVADQNSSGAQYEEYPFVLLECRGVDSSTAPPSQQLSPQTCWTQTWSEHYQDSFGDTYPPYRLDQYAPPADQAAVVGAPSPLPDSCAFDETAPVQHWVPFVAADGEVYDGGSAGCAGEPPESTDVGGSGLPSNETFGVTAPDGSGSAQFDVWTSDQNASLGCSQTVACSLVAIPIMGVSCAVSSTTPPSDVAGCEATGAFTPGQLMPNAGGSELSVTGSLWWTPSNWRNRISVPLSFATPASVCSVVNADNVVDVYGSELMVQATGQWEPYFCLGDNPGSEKFSFIHVQSSEPESRNLIAAGTAEAAFTSYPQPGGYGKPVVNAPVALTGFAISYDIDGSNGQPYTSLKLTPLLLAKLLTESYPADLPVQQADPALAHNPLNITLDPEFEALNPGITPNSLGASEAASELIAVSSDSDVIEALTTYINDDPTARAWLDGKPDPAGMVVNPAYEGIKLPVDHWPLLDTFEPTDWYQSDNNDCLYNDPVPYLPLVAAPLANLESVSESLQYDLPNSTTVCSQPVPGSAQGEKLVTNGRQPVGSRFMIGITPLADSERYQLHDASLETTAGTFVGPDSASLAAAGSLLTEDPTTGTWPIPYGTFSQPAGAAAYPGTMVVYAAVPTSGLPATDASDLGALLQFAASSGQTPGSGVGQLPAGYLPLTAANGLGALSAYTEAAAKDVAAQNGEVPGSTTAGAEAGSRSTITGPSSLAAEEASGDRGSSGRTLTSPSTTVSSTAAPTHGPGGRRSARVVFLGLTPGIALWTGSALLVVVLGASLAGALGVPVTLRRGRRRRRW